MIAVQMNEAHNAVKHSFEKKMTAFKFHQVFAHLILACREFGYVNGRLLIVNIR